MFHYRFFKLFVPLALVLLALAVAANANAARIAPSFNARLRVQDAEAPLSLVYPPDAIISGKSYAEWNVAWNRWYLSIPVATNPAFDDTGAQCQTGQSGPVFFLAGTGNPAPITRTCTVPTETPLFFPLITAECSNVEPYPFYGATDAARRDCADAIIDGVNIKKLEVTLDGHKIKRLDRFRVMSPGLKFTMPADDNVLGLPGVTKGRSRSDGYWLMLKPLAAGEHTLQFKAAITSGVGAGYHENVTYTLTASP